MDLSAPLLARRPPVGLHATHQTLSTWPVSCDNLHRLHEARKCSPSSVSTNSSFSMSPSVHAAERSIRGQIRHVTCLALDPTIKAESEGKLILMKKAVLCLGL